MIQKKYYVIQEIISRSTEDGVLVGNFYSKKYELKLKTLFVATFEWGRCGVPTTYKSEGHATRCVKTSRKDGTRAHRTCFALSHRVISALKSQRWATHRQYPWDIALTELSIANMRMRPYVCLFLIHDRTKLTYVTHLKM